MRAQMAMLAAVLVIMVMVWTTEADPGPGPAVAAAKSSAGATPSLAKLVDSLAKPFAPIGPESRVSSQCREHSRVYLRALGQLAPWAMHMYDSSTKIPSALLTGNIVQLGNYDQCLAVKVPDESGSDVFRGKHCASVVRFLMPGGEGESEFGNLLLAAANASGQRLREGAPSAPYEWAHCVPSSCSGGDVEAALLLRLRQLGLDRDRVSVVSRRCAAAGEARRSQPFQAADVVYMCLLIVTVYILAASTACDFFVVSKREANGHNISRTQRVLAAFSLRRNGRALFSMSVAPDTLGCVHGLRVASICWVVMLHAAYQDAIAPNINKADIQQLGDYVGNMVVMNATLSTDTFFLISATLLTIGFLRARGPPGGGAGGFNLLTFYWHRYIRLTPVYAMVIGFYATLLVRLGSGPRWDELLAAEQDLCLASWWANLAYLNNFLQVEMPCMNQTWYLAVDMQLFWLSPLLLLPLWKWRRAGRCLLAGVFVLSVAAPFTVTLCRRLSAAMLYTLDQDMLAEVYFVVYSRFYHRAGPYVLGMALGSLLHETRDRKVRLPGLLVAACWLASAAMCLAVLFGVFQFYRPDHPYSAYESALYAGLHRSAWAAGVAWVVFACVRGYGGPVNALLSWRALLPLSRVSYCLYLCHYAVLAVSHGLARAPSYFSPYFVVRDALGSLLISVVVAALLTLSFEMPFLNLDRILVSRGPSPKLDARQEGETAQISTTHNEDIDATALRGYDNETFER